MMHTARYHGLWFTGLCALVTSGCITITPNSPSFSLKSLTQPKVQQAAYEEPVEEAPADPKNPAQLKLAYARLMENAGQHGEARKQYSAVVEMQPKNVDAILGLARLEQITGNMDDAEQGFKRAVKLAPESPVAQHALGQFYASKKQWAQATDPLTKAMLSAPDQSQYRYDLAVALAHQGDVDSALPHFIRTIGDAEAHYNVGLILQEEGRIDEAERQFLLAVTKKPELTQARNWLAHLRAARDGTPSTDSPVPGPANRVLPAGHSAAEGPDFAPPLRTSQLSSQPLPRS